MNSHAIELYVAATEGGSYIEFFTGLEQFHVNNITTVFFKRMSAHVVSRPDQSRISSYNSNVVQLWITQLWYRLIFNTTC